MGGNIQMFSHKRRGILAVAVLLLVSLFLFGMLVRADDAEEEPFLYKYYTSVQIRPGDTLWDIASEYCRDPGQIRKYMKELKRINHLGSDEIHAGRYLTVVYYSKEYK